jgi:hypothetical protein
MIKKKLKLDPVAPLPGGDMLVKVCDDGHECKEGESCAPQLAIASRGVPGKPAPMGTEAGHFEKLDDGHLEFEPFSARSAEKIQFEDRSGHAGPAQVATDAYRSGWEATFGKN